VLVGACVTLAALLLATRLGPRIGRGTQAIVTRFMGLIVASMGMQFVPVCTENLNPDVVMVKPTKYRG
jgi:small neutral amino acid transporter SnatA (MarC family)